MNNLMSFLPLSFWVLFFIMIAILVGLLYLSYWVTRPEVIDAEDEYLSKL